MQVNKNADTQMKASESRDSSGALSRRKSKYDRALLGRYKMLRTIGTGNFAKVKLAIHLLTGKEVAIKVIDKNELSPSSRKKLSREVNLMKVLNHPNIIKLLEIIQTDKMMYLVLEYASGGELYEYLFNKGRMKEKVAREKFRQILSAVEYCHQKHIIHRDLKMENLLLDSKSNIKLADFGFANTYEEGKKLNTFCGSPPYAAPELFKGKEYEGPEVDVWSLGVILFKMVTGTLPFDGHSLSELRERILSGKYRIPFYMSTECERMLRKMLVLNPKKRCTIKELMKDPWVNIGYENETLLPHVEPQVDHTDRRKVEQLLDIGFGLETIVRSLKTNAFDEITATYFLLDKSENSSPSTMSSGHHGPSGCGSEIDTNGILRPSKTGMKSNEQDHVAGPCNEISAENVMMRPPDSEMQHAGNRLSTVIQSSHNVERVITINGNLIPKSSETNMLLSINRDPIQTHLNRTSTRAPGCSEVPSNRRLKIVSLVESREGPNVGDEAAVLPNPRKSPHHSFATAEVTNFTRMSNTRQTIHSAYRPDIKIKFESAGAAENKNDPLSNPCSNLSALTSDENSNTDTTADDLKMNEKPLTVLKSLANRLARNNLGTNQNGQERGWKSAIPEKALMNPIWNDDAQRPLDGNAPFHHQIQRARNAETSERVKSGFMRAISLRFSRRKIHNQVNGESNSPRINCDSGHGKIFESGIVDDVPMKENVPNLISRNIPEESHPGDANNLMDTTELNDFSQSHGLMHGESSPEEQAKPKAFRFKWYMKATSKLSAEELTAEVRRVLIENCFEFVQHKKFLFICTDGHSVCELEICEVTRENQRGLRFKKISGSSMNYKSMYTRIIDGLKL